MTLHHRLNSPRLVHLLQQWGQGPGEPVRLDTAERLSLWLSAFDAVRFNGAMQAIEGYPSATRPQGQPVPRAGLEAAYQRVVAELNERIRTYPTPAQPPRGRGGRLPLPAFDPQAEAEFATHVQRYLVAQKQLESPLEGLRTQVRQHLSTGVPAWRQLAALDAVMEQMVGAQAQKLWATLPGHLEARWTHWRQRHQQQLATTGLDDEPSRWRDSGGWLHAFEQDCRSLLQAELQVRLQPIVGLLEAAQNEHMEHV